MMRLWRRGVLGCSAILATAIYKNEANPWNYNWDFMDNVYEGDAKVHNDDCHHILLVRHGNYCMSKEPSKMNLTELGRKQATLTGQKLKQLNIKFDNIYTSTMVRARETTDLILSEIGDEYKVEADALLEEGPPCRPEPVTTNYKIYSRSLFVHSARIETAFRKFIRRLYPSNSPPEIGGRDSYTLIVCHANVIRYFVCRALQFPTEGWLRLSLDHASITKLSIFSDGRVVLESYSDASHMPPSCVTR